MFFSPLFCPSEVLAASADEKGGRELYSPLPKSDEFGHS